MNLIHREDPDHIGTELGGQVKWDAFGCKYVRVYATQALVLNTPYMITPGAYGLAAVTMAAAGTTKIGIADAAVATGGYGWLAVYGPHDAVVVTSATATDGDALKVHTDGTLISDAAVMTGSYQADQPAVALEAKGSGTSVTIKVFLLDREVTWT